MALITSASNATAVLVSSHSSREVVSSAWFTISGVTTNVKIYDDCLVTVHNYCGLSETAAETLAASLRSNSLADYRIRSSSASSASWMVAPLANGTKVSADVQRVVNSKMFTVVKTTETHTCSNSAGWNTY